VTSAKALGALSVMASNGPAQLERAVRTAAKACGLVIAQPKDTLARQRLFDALSSVLDPDFAVDGPEFDHLTDLCIEARLWADIVRTRITGLQKNKGRDPSALAIQYPARDLLPILADLACELGRMQDRARVD
jgi:hypothetical protein